MEKIISFVISAGRHCTTAFVITLTVFLFALFSCASGGGTDTNSSRSSAVVEKPAQVNAPAPPPPPNPYFSGEGGKGISITILPPRATNMIKDMDYLPALVQGEFVNNFSGYSAISVRDRGENLDQVYAELNSGYYDDNAQEGRDLGHLTPTTHILGGNITKTSTGYAFQIQITKTADKMTAASYSGTCTIEELNNYTGIRRASLDLLQQMGVTPTERTRTELAGAAEAKHINSTTALAQGITAKQGGREVEALTYYYQAAAYDPSLLEAGSRVSVLTANISSGNIGEDARTKVRWYEDWKARLEEANTFFANYIANNQPLCEIVYSTGIEEGEIDYTAKTMPFTFSTRLFTAGPYYTALEKAVQTVSDGLAATKMNDEWRLTWPGDFARYRSFPVSYDVDFDLVNSNNKVIGTRRTRLSFNWSISGRDRIEVSRPSPGTERVTITAKVDDITENLTIRVRAVNGKDPQAANVRISAISGRPPADGDYQFDHFTGELYGIGRSVTNIPASIWGVPVSSFRSGIFKNNKQLTRVIISDSVKSIGDSVFEGNGLTSVTIPEGVTSIGDSAFKGNKLTSVIIPSSVTSIGNSAFAENGLVSVTISEGVTSIGNSAFRVNHLTSVTIPGSVRSIGDHAFYYNKLTSVTISEGVTSIGPGAFFGNSFGGLFRDRGAITIPSSVTSIGEYAFGDAFGLDSVTFLGRVTSIGEYAFYWDSLTSVTIPEGVTIIDTKSRSMKSKFIAFYNKNGKKAGKYSSPGHSARWTYSPN